ncbi:hypothetical protein J6590_002471 [Homalodisca vitripennis]|nr:hypothetical protein J6590_002471 [Homalodisca vitripennis]
MNVSRVRVMPDGRATVDPDPRLEVTGSRYGVDPAALPSAHCVNKELTKAVPTLTRTRSSHVPIPAGVGCCHLLCTAPDHSQE